MKLAFISDVHANAPALMAVLRDISSRGIKRIYCAGDILGYGPFPNESLTLLRRWRIPTIWGNYDHKVFYFPRHEAEFRRTKKQEKYASFRWTYRKLSINSLIRMSGWASRMEFSVRGRRILMVHGTPRSYEEGIYPNATRAFIEAISEGYEYDVLVCGHTHLPFVEKVGEKLIMNVGSVGKPVDGDTRATYGILTLGERAYRKIVRVEYDLRALTTALARTSLPGSFARQFEQASKY